MSTDAAFSFLSPNRFIVGGEGWGEGEDFALAGGPGDLARLPRAFDRLPAPESLSFEWPKESNQRKGHPDGAPCGCACGLRGFSTAHPCAGEKLARIPASHPSDFPPPTRRAIGAPEGQQQKQLQQLKQQLKQHAQLNTAPLALTPSPLRGEGWGEGRVLAKTHPRSQIKFLPLTLPQGFPPVTTLSPNGEAVGGEGAKRAQGMRA